jgi:hypothetical protein
MPLGNGFDAGGTPSCAALKRFAGHHRGLQLAAASAPDSVMVKLPTGGLPSGWKSRKRFPGAVLPSRSGSLEIPFELPRDGRWQVWVGGAVLGQLSLRIDDDTVATIRHRVNRPSEYEPVARVTLASGRHLLAFDYRERLLGGMNDRFPMGPVALTPIGAPDNPIVLPARRVNSLCGERLDWIEAGSQG